MKHFPSALLFHFRQSLGAALLAASWAAAPLSGADADVPGSGSYSAALTAPPCAHPGLPESIYSARSPVTAIFKAGIGTMRKIRVESVRIETSATGESGLGFMRSVRVYLCRDNGDRMIQIGSSEALRPGAGSATLAQCDRLTYLDDVMAGATISLRVEYTPDELMAKACPMRCIVNLSGTKK